MPRMPRRCPGGVVYHALNRSVARVTLFRNDGDYLAFEHTLEEAHARLPTARILAYCIMPNHFHLALFPTADGELSEFMQWLTLAHAQRWRAAHNTVGFGPLYQGRFKSFPVQDDHHLLTILRYVERNPLRANLVARAQDWRWSSLHCRLAGTPDPLLLAPPPVALPDNWTRLVNAPQSPAEEAALAAAIARSRPFGDDTWQRATAHRLHLAHSLRPPRPPPQVPHPHLTPPDTKTGTGTVFSPPPDNAAF